MKQVIKNNYVDVLMLLLFWFFNEYFYDTDLFHAGRMLTIPVLLVKSAVLVAFANVSIYLLTRPTTVKVTDHVLDPVETAVKAIFVENTKTKTNILHKIARIFLYGVLVMVILLLGYFIVSILMDNILFEIGCIVIILRIYRKYDSFD